MTHCPECRAPRDKKPPYLLPGSATISTAAHATVTAFWDTYGPHATSAATWRSLVYEARYLGAIRLERHRLHNSSGVRDTYTSMSDVLPQLT
ncbi:hypothetical protein [Streptomyces sp. Tue6028]|uniref:hypothetical protein n=1 Tax=Streptomyces sp. Tue6028 TaxID=2036037 RepID=UPI003EBD881F